MSVPDINLVSEVIEKGTCPKCGNLCELRVGHWKNDIGIVQENRPDWRCEACGDRWNDQPGSYREDLRAAFSAPHDWLERGVADDKELACGLPKPQAELADDLHDLGTDWIRRLVVATEASSDSAFLAVRAASDDDRFQIFDDRFKRYCAELVLLQSSLINGLGQAHVSHKISSKDQHWVTEAANLIWNQAKNAHLRWIIQSLGVSADATKWIAPQWIYFGHLRAIKLLAGDEWDATQKLLISLRHWAETKLSYEREQALKAALRAVRLQSTLQAPSKAKMKGGLSYRSGSKRAVLLVLIQKPNASDLEICQFIDEHVALAGRDWEDVYLNQRKGKHRIESLITSVRRDMRDRGLLA